MKKLVIMPGGFHPFHAGHLALYNSALQAFPDADVYVAATADTSERPFPFEIKQKLARAAGVPADRFVQVKSPFQAREIVANYDPQDTQLIFVRSDKDRDSQPRPGGNKKDGSPSYLQPYSERESLPLAQRGYMAYLPTVEFGSGMKSATEIRRQWPNMSDDDKINLVQSMYSTAAKNPKLAKNVVAMLDTVLNPMQENQGWAATLEADIRPAGGLGTWSEDSLRARLVEKLQAITAMMRSRDYTGVAYAWNDPATRAMIQALADLDRKTVTDSMVAGTPAVGGMTATYQARENQPNLDYIEEKWSEKYKRSINCARPRGFSQKAHCAGRKK